MTARSTRPRRRLVATGTLALLALAVGGLTACTPPTPAATDHKSASSTPTASDHHAASSAPASSPAKPKLHMISNEGHRLAFYVTPGHLPAIVLDAGGGLGAAHWKKLVPVLAKETGSKIITYDRAGEGKSDEVPGPWKASDAVSDLKAGLTKLGVTHDVVLVSHSLAGEVATYFARGNPDWVSGAVLVDASLPQFYTDSEVDRIIAAKAPKIAALKKKHPKTKEMRQLLAQAVNYGPAHRAYHQVSWPSNVPATVIVSAETPFDTPTDAQLWRDAAAKFVDAAPNRRLVVAKKSSHDIPTDRPEVITKAVDALVQQVG